MATWYDRLQAFRRVFTAQLIWMPMGPKKIEIVFTTGTSGLEMQLTVQGETLQGNAKTFWDFLRRRQTAHIIAHKINCAN